MGSWEVMIVAKKMRKQTRKQKDAHKRRKAYREARSK
jgi:hypothetical protein